ncbi:MAG: hypothetical protein MK486_06405 [Gemmatimonadetes bacterium]|jgi:hypothetical protein|nr:hypothetical protein [Gemmatimonadota bacterium]MEE2847696.1 hypothetical protein [Gemmatimonadota bacterium]|tara:strand:- start:3013 stop:3690 length:678 start_codon:yes stop_codon:yes gene_type:complete
MPPKQSLWFRLGYALERAREGPPAAGRSLRGLAEQQTKPLEAEGESGPGPAWPSIDSIVASGASAAVAKVLNGWKPQRKASTLRLLRAGAAGAAAALLVDMLRPLIRGEPGVGPLDKETVDRLIAGIGQGLVYGAVVEPRIPGPTLVKGALYGTAEYAVDPVGGLSRLLGPHAPQHRLPVIGHLLEDLDPHDRAYAEHMVFGVALALLYGSSPSSNGIRIDVDDE